MSTFPAKRLKDYPQKEWIEAADGCEFCEEKFFVQITDVDGSGNFGSIKWRIYHKEDCPERLEEEEEILVAAEEFKEGEDVAGWEFYEHTIMIKGMTFYPIKSRANIGPCLICGKLVIRVPLILFINEGKKGELDFCFDCTKDRGILNQLTKGK